MGDSSNTVSGDLVLVDDGSSGLNAQGNPISALTYKFIEWKYCYLRK